MAYICSLFDTYLALTCVDLPTPVNGAITFSSLAPYEFGATASYSCNTGYGLGGGDVTRSCGGDGSSTNGGWSGTPPTCNSKIVNLQCV